jgi:NAD-dependent SIR2 family protein deacetylase
LETENEPWISKNATYFLTPSSYRTSSNVLKKDRYDKLDRLNLPFPEAIFDISFYRKDPSPFVELAKEIWPGQKGGPKPTLAHFFVSLLERKGCLRRVYTQNIDGLEGLAGVSEEKLVECHGHFRSCSCTSPQCRAKNALGIDECRQAFLRGEAYNCPECGSVAKPDIVFFGETLPDRFQELIDDDVTSCDLLIVMGTSLLVAPVAQIPEWVGTSVPRLLINRELVGDFAKEVMLGGGHTDVFMEGDCDHGVQELCRLVGGDWEQELVALREKALQE